MSWSTQPLCWGCWEAERGSETPTRLINAPPELCCLCGYMTQAGIYIRIDSSRVRFPREEAQ